MATQLEDLTDEQDPTPNDVEGDDDRQPANDDDGTDEQEGDDEEVDVVSWGNDAVAAEDEPEGMRNLREALKREKQARKDAEARFAPKVDDVGPEPDMDEYWENPDQYKVDLLAWNERKRKADEAGQEVEKLNQSVAEDVEAGQRAYQEQRQSLRIPGFEAADDKVIEALPEIFLNAVNLAAGEKAAALRFYLGTNPEQLAKLTALNPRKVTDLIKAAALAGSMAKEINVQRRKPTTTPIDNHAARGASGGGSGSANKTLDRLEKEAAASGDRTKLIAYRRQLREQGK